MVKLKFFKGKERVNFLLYSNEKCHPGEERLNKHLSYKRGVAGPKMATGSNYFKKL